MERLQARSHASFVLMRGITGQETLKTHLSVASQRVAGGNKYCKNVCLEVAY